MGKETSTKESVSVEEFTEFKKEVKEGSEAQANLIADLVKGMSGVKETMEGISAKLTVKESEEAPAAEAEVKTEEEVKPEEKSEEKAELDVEESEDEDSGYMIQQGTGDLSGGSFTVIRSKY